MASLTITLRRRKALFGISFKGKYSGKVEDNIPAPASHPRLLQYEELPVWYQDNPQVRTAYRPVSYSVSSCIHSLTYLHNETVNTYTHLIPAIFIILSMPATQLLISRYYPEATALDRFIFTLNLLSAFLTFILSSAYHTLMNHSATVSALCLRIDYAGILALILASFISGIYVGFYCHPFLQNLYWSMIATFSTIAATLVLHPSLQGQIWRSTRTTTFILTGLSGFAPIAHGLYIYGWEQMWEHSGMPFWFAEGACYGIGAWFFASRVPEKWRWGMFDIWGSSHQIFHVWVVIGAVVHLWGVWDAWGSVVSRGGWKGCMVGR
ncbi:HlyIII-domain-containing protein [Lepidopterella palustris CBS 459.81]|uniref:HlyIII-domain-containing protein n=1 Tax=Lepidopterella palustris CBS 459.81 TaxID=1314670 RepID=A0A8E2JEC3_9PEZI|nr:HlyIII-domain-containing protein [Lepidopterella palustris CBS 459.81]